jgi:hypothetical protein
MKQRTSGDYSEGLTAASLSGLLELEMTLRSYRGSITLVGGWVPYLLIREFGKDDFRHVGSIDIDLAVDPDKVDLDAYATIVELIEGRGWSEQKLKGEANPHSYVKTLPSPLDGKAHEIKVDFLTTPSPDKHRHRKVQPDLPARKARGCGLAFRHNIEIDLRGTLPGDGEAETKVRMLDIPGCLGMKGIALGERYFEKDAYDIFSVVSQCHDGPEAVAREVRPRLEDGEMTEGIDVIRRDFRDIRANGPSWVANFVGGDEESKKRQQAEAFAVMREFLDALK